MFNIKIALKNVDNLENIFTYLGFIFLAIYFFKTKLYYLGNIITEINYVLILFHNIGK